MEMEPAAECRSTDATRKERLLACPFFAREPLKYIVRPHMCARRGWNTAQWKDHLYKVHFVANRCPFCCNVFGSEPDLNTHLDRRHREQQCIKRELHWTEGFGPTQKESIRKRTKPKGHREMSPDEMNACIWNTSFKTLFPDFAEQAYPSPFYDEIVANVHAQYERVFHPIRERYGDALWQEVASLATTALFPTAPGIGASQYAGSSTAPTQSYWGDNTSCNQAAETATTSLPDPPTSYTTATNDDEMATDDNETMPATDSIIQCLGDQFDSEVWRDTATDSILYQTEPHLEYNHERFHDLFRNAETCLPSSAEDAAADGFHQDVNFSEYFQMSP